MIEKSFKILENVLTGLIIIIGTINCQQCDRDRNCNYFDDVTNENRYSLEAAKHTNFMLYDVSFEEGFNLRRDVYIRIATLVKRLGSNWTLVLPEWTDLPHWELDSDEELRKSKKWSTYFDIEGLNSFVRVIEMEKFLLHFNSSKIKIDSVMSLEHLDQFDENNFEENFEIIKANKTRYYVKRDGMISHRFYDNYNSKFNYESLYEIRIEGFDTTLYEMIQKHFNTDKILLISNAETILHFNYGNKFYWTARRSMRFANHLRLKGDQFRKLYLQSNDDRDRTTLDKDCTLNKNSDHALGGAFVAVHYRRKDFAYYRNDLVPDAECAVRQINFVVKNLLDTRHIDKIYIATDAEQNEYEELKRLLEEKGHQVYNYKRVMSRVLPGELAIIDQWISAHAEFFIGTLESAFSLQIQQEREILRFQSNTTYNALCPKCDIRLMLKICKQNTSFKIVY